MKAEYLTDGIHPNNAGHQAMADAVNLYVLLK
jgi:lysophospholipase L1-like esterase